MSYDRPPGFNPSRRRLQDKPCAFCGKIFRPQYALKLFCSRSCAANALKDQSNLIGLRFGFLTVVRKLEEERGPTTWLCLCVCGKHATATSSRLTHERKRSCGCLKQAMINQSKITHGMSGTPEHKIWKDMIKRCENQNNRAYVDYGGRGITVCPEWRLSFQAFYEHIGPRPAPDLSVDRIDNDRGYEPGNVRWATRKEQANNKRKRRWQRKPKDVNASL